jgi:CheY-like chemotaxis protein
VVSNLLTNAAKYTPLGGDITVRVAPDQGDIVVRVKDNGIGIAPDVLPRVFDLFVQGRQAIDRSQGGLGLGLAIVRNLVERHGGSVSAHSDGLGRGSEFVVRLPRAVVTAATDGSNRSTMRRPADRVGTARHARRILVVDDNEDAAVMLAEALQAWGHATRVAHDGPTALRMAEAFNPDIAFLDIGLPVMDGYELAGRLRTLPGLAGIRLIAVTGYGQQSDREKSGAAGFSHHLVKPVDFAVVDSVVNGESSSARGISHS